MVLDPGSRQLDAGHTTTDGAVDEPGQLPHGAIDNVDRGREPLFVVVSSRARCRRIRAEAREDVAQAAAVLHEHRDRVQAGSLRARGARRLRRWWVGGLVRLGVTGRVDSAGRAKISSYRRASLRPVCRSASVFSVSSAASSTCGRCTRRAAPTERRTSSPTWPKQRVIATSSPPLPSSAASRSARSCRVTSCACGTRAPSSRASCRVRRGRARASSGEVARPLLLEVASRLELLSKLAEASQLPPAQLPRPRVRGAREPRLRLAGPTLDAQPLVLGRGRDPAVARGLEG